jgi:hypothetical protein
MILSNIWMSNFENCGVLCFICVGLNVIQNITSIWQFFGDEYIGHMDLEQLGSTLNMTH